MQSKSNTLLRFWFSPMLPQLHYNDKVGFLKKWFFNPLKRYFARWYLMFLQRFTNIKVIGLTGSAGKTSTKEMLASILKLEGLCVYSKANIDPVYNIPNTILRSFPGTKYLILEMGVEYPGEMDFYLWLAKPDIGIITNIFPTHTKFLENIDGVFKEKSKLVLSLTKNGIAILNSGDTKLKSLKGKLRSKVVWFEYDKDPLKQNALTASAAAQALGVSDFKIKKGLADYQKPPHRLNIVKDASGAFILDDSYNSNPWAAISTLNYFNGIAKGKKIAFLGDMLELGEFDESAHRELGRKVAESNFSAVIGIGKSSTFLIDEVKKLSSGTQTYLFSTVGESRSKFHEFLKKGNFILVKGSRSIGLDKLVDELS